MVVVSALWIAPLGCFVGSDARGLPCERDVDCGIHDRCIDGVCGGPPGTTGATGPGESAGSTASDSTGGPVCGDGKRELGEICEPPDDPVPCGLDCVPLLCGDGHIDPPVEVCDDGVAGERVDTRTCDADCTAVACGDGHWNPAAEYCDRSDDASPQACDDGCRPILLAYAEGDGFTVERALGDAAMWPTGSGWTRAAGVWSSGPDVADPLPPANRSLAGCTYLVSPVLDLRSDATGANWAADVTAGVIPLRWHVSHELAFADCADNPVGSDGGVFAIRVEGESELEIVAPLGGYGGTISDQCSAVGRTANPLLGSISDPPAYTGGAALDDVAIDLSAWVGQRISIVFAACYDCVQCSRETPAGWRIHATSVVASDTPASG